MAPKELGFFTDRFDEGLSWYAEQFRAAAARQILGEATADYLARPSAMSRIAASLPNAKMIASLRNPVDRAWSHYLLLAERGREVRSFAAAIDEETRLIEQHGAAAKGAFYLYHSLYDAQLERAFELVGRDRIHVVIFERMAADPEQTYRTLCRYLGVDDQALPPNLGDRVNPYVTFRSLRMRELGARLPRPARRLVARLNTRQGVTPPQLDPALRSQLSEFFAPRIVRVESMLGSALPEWKVPPART
jgi:hypothetical protein